MGHYITLERPTTIDLNFEAHAMAGARRWNIREEDYPEGEAKKRPGFYYRGVDDSVPSNPCASFLRVSYDGADIDEEKPKPARRRDARIDSPASSLMVLGSFRPDLSTSRLPLGVRATVGSTPLAAEERHIPLSHLSDYWHTALVAFENPPPQKRSSLLRLVLDTGAKDTFAHGPWVQGPPHLRRAGFLIPDHHLRSMGVSGTIRYQDGSDISVDYYKGPVSLKLFNAPDSLALRFITIPHFTFGISTNMNTTAARIGEHGMLGFGPSGFSPVADRAEIWSFPAAFMKDTRSSVAIDFFISFKHSLLDNATSYLYFSETDEIPDELRSSEASSILPENVSKAYKGRASNYWTLPLVEIGLYDMRTGEEQFWPVLSGLCILDTGAMSSYLPTAIHDALVACFGGFDPESDSHLANENVDYFTALFKVKTATGFEILKAPAKWVYTFAPEMGDHRARRHTLAHINQNSKIILGASFYTAFAVRHLMFDEWRPAVQIYPWRRI